MLAKTFKKESQLLFPVVFSEKLDGVAVDFFAVETLDGGPKVFARSRQDEPLLSVDHIRQYLLGKLPNKAHLICELYIPGEDFKDISGIVRRHETTGELYAFIYDFYIEGQEHLNYMERMNQMVSYLGKYIIPDLDVCPVQFIAAVKVDTLEDWHKVLPQFFALRPDAEGVVIRSLYEKAHYKPGWRSPGMLKHKVTNTIDLGVQGFEEAICKDTGNGLGMVGRINVFYKGEIIGVGPGKMTHEERKHVFANQPDYINKIIEVAYMPDASYDALREPRFYRWRDDKQKPNEE